MAMRSRRWSFLSTVSAAVVLLFYCMDLVLVTGTESELLLLVIIATVTWPVMSSNHLHNQHQHSCAQEKVMTIKCYSACLSQVVANYSKILVLKLNVWLGVY